MTSAADGQLPEGNRHVLRRGGAPDAPATEGYEDHAGQWGYVTLPTRPPRG